jgi:hypothetical protein
MPITSVMIRCPRCHTRQAFSIEGFQKISKPFQFLRALLACGKQDCGFIIPLTGFLPSDKEARVGAPQPQNIRRRD